MTRIDDRDTRFNWVEDAMRESQDVRQTTVEDKRGSHIHLAVPGETGVWVRMPEEHTVPAVNP